MSPGLLSCHVPGFVCWAMILRLSSEESNVDSLMVEKLIGQKMKSSTQDQVSIGRFPFFDQLIF
ncbi:hypothetical protein TBK1r_28430 [Stieleria magnilauensis]|uniref:Uncharacterized protein n=1 Tax=Stieleria magnilauensis TaxID=2527963 RepID=A0ABX5XR87_9BACT|nr:hypothetical protein TBK1r_28430 [Planctomycetes bacterium TBK1r]